MSTPLADPLARFDYRLRIAAALLRSAPRREHLVVVGMVLTSAAAAWPVDGALYPMVAIPALLALAALIRHHLDGLDARRDALTAAGANAADTLVIQSAGPLAATGIGALAGIVAAVALLRFPTHALAPLAVGALAALVMRRAWLGAPALAAGSLGALVTAVAVRAGTRTAEPPTELRSRLVAVGHDAVVAHNAHAAGSTAVTHASAWSIAWPTAVAGALALAATQAAVAHRDALKQFARRLTARSSA
jgi:hypothetical protein